MANVCPKRHDRLYSRVPKARTHTSQTDPADKQRPDRKGFKYILRYLSTGRGSPTDPAPTYNSTQSDRQTPCQRHQHARTEVLGEAVPDGADHAGGPGLGQQGPALFVCLWMYVHVQRCKRVDERLDDLTWVGSCMSHGRAAAGAIGPITAHVMTYAANSQSQ